MIKVTLSRNWKEDMYLLVQLPEPIEGSQVLAGTKQFSNQVPLLIRGRAVASDLGLLGSICLEWLKSLVFL